MMKTVVQNGDRGGKVLKFLKRSKLHALEHIAPWTWYYKGSAAVKCKRCGQQFVIDAIGGWMMEWDFVLVEEGKHVDTSDFDKAIAHLRNSYHNPKIKNSMYDRSCK